VRRRRTAGEAHTRKTTGRQSSCKEEDTGHALTLSRGRAALLETPSTTWFSCRTSTRRWPPDSPMPPCSFRDLPHRVKCCACTGHQGTHVRGCLLHRRRGAGDRRRPVHQCMPFLANLVYLELPRLDQRERHYWTSSLDISGFLLLTIHAENELFYRVLSSLVCRASRVHLFGKLEISLVLRKRVSRILEKSFIMFVLLIYATPLAKSLHRGNPKED
jgi:hypothetical protein